MIIEPNWCYDKLTLESLAMVIKKTSEKIKGSKCAKSAEELSKLNESLGIENIKWSSVASKEDRVKSTSKILNHYNIKSLQDIQNFMKRQRIYGYSVPEKDGVEPIDCFWANTDTNAQAKVENQAEIFRENGFGVEVVKNENSLKEPSKGMGNKNWCLFITKLPE